MQFITSPTAGRNLSESPCLRIHLFTLFFDKTFESNLKTQNCPGTFEAVCRSNYFILSTRKPLDRKSPLAIGDEPAAEMEEVPEEGPACTG